MAKSMKHHHAKTKHRAPRKAPPPMMPPMDAEPMGGEPEEPDADDMMQGAEGPAAGAQMAAPADGAAPDQGTGYKRGGRTTALQREALHKHRKNRSRGGRC